MFSYHMIQYTCHVSEGDFLALGGNVNVGVISITDPGRSAPIIENQWGPILRLRFHDIDCAEYGYVVFTTEMADTILSWLDRYENKIQGVMVHCAAGISRSAAVAVFIAERYDLPLDRRRAAMYNRLVYGTLWNRWTKSKTAQDLVMEKRKIT